MTGQLGNRMSRDHVPSSETSPQADLDGWRVPGVIKCSQSGRTNLLDLLRRGLANFVAVIVEVLDQGGDSRADHVVRRGQPAFKDTGDSFLTVCDQEA